MKSAIRLSWKSEAWCIFITLATVALSFYFYAHFPEEVVGHWNFAGQPDDWTSRAGGAFGMVGVLIFMYVLFLVLPMLDPKKERYVDFEKVYHLFKNIMITFFVIIYVLAGLYNLGYPVSIQFWVPWLVGLLMIFIGNYLGKLKRNWFVGIKTPWTISSENVWNKTHRVGGWMFILFGVCIIISPNLPYAWGASVFIGGAMLATIGSMLYSYIVYLQEKKNK